MGSAVTAMHAQGQRWALGLVPPLLVALALRWLGLRDQVLTDDELHTVHGALTMPVGDIVRNWTFGGADYGVPERRSASGRSRPHRECRTRPAFLRSWHRSE